MKPALRISLGLLSITVSLVFCAYYLGLIPSEHKSALEARARICENLAVQLASLASRNDDVGIKDTVDTVLKRNKEILSIAIRGANGKLLVDSGDHDTIWREPVSGSSTENFVQIPLLSGDKPQGRIELAFRPLQAGNPALDPWREIASFVAFIAVAGFIGYFLVLHGVLREVAPERAIPGRIKAAYDTLAEGVLILDEHGTILLANEVFATSLGTTPGPLLGSDAAKLPLVMPGRGKELFPWQKAIRERASVLGIEARLRRPSGGDQRLIINATPIIDGQSIRGAIATFDDVTDLHRANEQLNDSILQLNLSQERISEQNRELQILASCDPLTGCLNRRTFFAEAEKMLTQSRDSGCPLGFLMLDADHFKSVNDRFGHAIGDKVLVGLADAIKRTCGDFGVIGRYGGEEFCAAVSGLTDREIEALAEKLRQTVANTNTWLPNGEAVTISIGIASDDANCTIGDLLKRADVALYTAKASGRNRFVTWADVELLNGVPEQIRAAIRDRKMFCEFQPKVDIMGRRVVGFEALVRWRCEGSRSHATEEFIRQAIELGLINQVTFFVLDVVVESIGALDAAFGSDTTISINVAAKLANDFDFMMSFAGKLRDSGIADRVVIELTEDSFISKGTFHTRILPILHDIGVRVSIDDFGTGYSSLSLLADIMADEIKIDRSLVSRIHERPRNQIVLRAISSLAKALEMDVVAEGVETFEELVYLRAVTNIRQVQGFYFSRPFPVEEVDHVKRRLAFWGQGAADSDRSMSGSFPVSAVRGAHPSRA